MLKTVGFVTIFSQFFHLVSVMFFLTSVIFLLREYFSTDKLPLESSKFFAKKFSFPRINERLTQNNSYPQSVTPQCLSFVLLFLFELCTKITFIYGILCTCWLSRRAGRVKIIGWRLWLRSIHESWPRAKYCLSARSNSVSQHWKFKEKLHVDHPWRLGL